MYSNVIMFVFVFIRNIGINSQGCLPVDRSPNNPARTDCDTTFFDLVSDPDSNCICCGVGQIDDNPANECLNANPPTPIKQASGTLTCNENFDCCSCSGLICNNCVALECAGDSSCIGVDDIEIKDACANQGASIICGGDVACYRTEITGECIKGITCNGDNSCGNSVFRFNQNIIVPESINSLKLEFNGDVSVPKTKIFAKNVDTVSCTGDDSCPDSEFTIECVGIGCGVGVGGDGGASGAKWIIDNVNKIECAGDEGCSRTTFTIACIDTGCPISINGDSGAIRSTWTITNGNSFVCSAENGCSRSTFIIDFISSGAMIECSGSCFRTTFIVYNTMGVLCNGLILGTLGTIQGGCERATFRLNNNIGGSILCDSTNACKNAIFTGVMDLDEATNINEVKCGSESSCQKASFRLSPNGADFKFLCGSVESCRQASILIHTPFNSIDTFSCDAVDSCRSTTAFIEGKSPNGLTINSLSFGGRRSGINAEFDIESIGDITINNILCSGEEACNSLSIHINLMSNSNTLSGLFIECAANRACVRARITILRRGSILSASQTRALNIVVNCNTGNACNRANINNIPFTSF